MHSANEIQSDVSLGPRGAEHDKNTLTDPCTPSAVSPWTVTEGRAVLFLSVCVCVSVFYSLLKEM